MSKAIKSITINGKTYVAKEFDFNMICDMQEMGINIADAKKVPMAMVRAYIAICMGVDKDEAGTEIESHVLNGGNLDKATEALLNKFENSDFFRKMSERATENLAEN